MLIIVRKPEQEIILDSPNGSIVLKVMGIDPGQNCPRCSERRRVKIGVQATQSVRIMRRELLSDEEYIRASERSKLLELPAEDEADANEADASRLPESKVPSPPGECED